MSIHVPSLGETSIALFIPEGVRPTGNKEAALSIKGLEVNLGSAICNLSAILRVGDGALCDRPEQPTLREGQVKAIADTQAFAD